MVLVATPFVRVGGSVVAFAREGDRRYVLITSVVLAVMCLGVLLGRAYGNAFRRGARQLREADGRASSPRTAAAARRPDTMAPWMDGVSRWSPQTNSPAAVARVALRSAKAAGVSAAGRRGCDRCAGGASRRPAHRTSRRSCAITASSQRRVRERGDASTVAETSAAPGGA